MESHSFAKYANEWGTRQKLNPTPKRRARSLLVFAKSSP